MPFPSNRLTELDTYDASDNLTQAVIYDYDANDRRTDKLDYPAGTGTGYVYDGDDVILSGRTINLNGPGSDQVLAEDQSAIVQEHSKSRESLTAGHIQRLPTPLPFRQYYPCYDNLSGESAEIQAAYLRFLDNGL